MTLMDFTSFEENDNVEADDVPSGKSGHFQADDELPHSIFVQDSTETPDDLEKTIEELQNKPWRKAKKRRFFSRQKPHDDADSLEPDFVTQANRKQRMGRTLRMAMAISSAALFIALIGQAAYAFRDQISARWPKMTPALAHACAILDCRIGLPARIDMLSIESSELQAPSSDRNTFTLVALLRNRSTFAQLWPHLELTLNDANEKPVVRRVFAPRDYLPASQELGKGFTPNSEQALKLNFTLAQLTASGYRLYLFYP